MKEYIEREAARMAACKLCDWYGSNMCAENKCDHPIEAVPAADVVGVKRGYWIKTGQSFVYPEKFINYTCSVCGFDIAKTEFNYCPNCGSKMDGGGDNG